ncbi:MAG: ribonuclease III [Acholeplasmatales bacterium]|nr:ribonuclease III [Acholeplasmatales bacterium]
MESNIINPNLLNGLSLAYIGDSVYEVYIRKYVLSKGVTKVNNLHKKVVNYTSGLAQSNIIHYLMENNMLSEEEIQIFKRGRNSHINTSRKNLDLQDYLDATGFESLIGYLYLNNNIERLEEIIKISIKVRGE